MWPNFTQLEGYGNCMELSVMKSVLDMNLEAKCAHRGKDPEEAQGIGSSSRCGFPSLVWHSLPHAPIPIFINRQTRLRYAWGYGVLTLHSPPVPALFFSQNTLTTYQIIQLLMYLLISSYLLKGSRLPWGLRAAP